jgi:hypothetical protein
MSQSAGHASDESVRFHQIVEHGEVEELQRELNRGVAVNAPGRLGKRALMLAVSSKDLEKVKLLIQHGADPELADDFNSTALRYAVEADFAAGVEFLISLGVDRGYRPRYPLKKIEYDYSLPDVAMPAELRGVMSEAEWKESLEETRRSMREMGQNPTVEPMISDVQSIEVLKLLLKTGDDLNLAPTEVKRALLGLETGGELRVAQSDYRRHKTPRYGSQNPERMDFPFWMDMIRTGGNAYSAREHFNDDHPFENPGAVWCYERFGSTLTPLNDGRFVQIGGEHEDYYDPDFYIYNDVVIHDGKGGYQIYGYPQDVFPSTDFHTATLCRDGIYIVGCLGYPEQSRQGFTPVYRLSLESWRIESVNSAGESPGWIHRHRAHYQPERNAICIAGGEIHVDGEDGESDLVANEQEFELDLSQFQWHRLK